LLCVGKLPRRAGAKRLCQNRLSSHDRAAGKTAHRATLGSETVSKPMKKPGRKRPGF
jgi:hypothetical protein